MWGLTEYSCQVEIICETLQSLTYVQSLSSVKFITGVVAVLNFYKEDIRNKMRGRKKRVRTVTLF